MGKDTKYDSVNSTLNAIGKAVFVNFYYDFKNPLMSEEKIAEKLFTENPNTTSHQQGFRVPRARHLFKEKKNLEALIIIAKSERVPQDSRDKAVSILVDEYKELCSKNEILVDSIYKHFKGNYYRIISIGLDSETLSPIVVYQDMNKKERTWVRPLMEWMSPVDNKEGNTARFAKVSFD